MVTCHSWQANQFISGIQIFVWHETYIHSLENANQCDAAGQNKSSELIEVLLQPEVGGNHLGKLNPLFERICKYADKYKMNNRISSEYRYRRVFINISQKQLG